MKKRVALIFGGESSEYEVSLKSAYSVIEHFDYDTYDLIKIIVSEKGEWFHYFGDNEKIKEDTWMEDKYKEKINISLAYPDLALQTSLNRNLKIDVAFPLIHGQHGEDGTLQGLLEMLHIPYVGCKVLSSSLCMDKEVSHALVKSQGIQVSKYCTCTNKESLETIEKKVQALSFPVFVKPANAGSSYGISKIYDLTQLKKALESAFEHDYKAIIEETIYGFEIGCAIIGNESLQIGEVDEIEIHDEFFGYEEKYHTKTAVTHCPARIPEFLKEDAKQKAIQIYRILQCTGFARIDLFVNENQEIVFNEVNTIPGFTSSSRFPNMLKQVGLSYQAIINTLIELALS